jgi:hypothetical protein
MRRTLLLLALATFLKSSPVAAQAAFIPARGINIHDQSDSALRFIPQWHLNWVRIDVAWSSMQTGNGEPINWTNVDNVVNAAYSRGLHIYANVGSTPNWACHVGWGTNCVPYTNYWSTFMTQVATRYRNVIWVYGIGNEPDLSKNWSGSPADYANSLLAPAGAAIRQADGGALIAAPDLAGAAPQFFTAISNSNLTGYVDIVSQHVYNDCSADTAINIINKFQFGECGNPSLLSYINASALHDRPIWITETGFNTGGDAGGGSSVSAVYEDFRLYSPQVKAVFDYELMDNSNLTFGLIHQYTETWKPGAYTLQTNLKYDTTKPDPPLVTDGFDYPYSSQMLRWSLPNPSNYRGYISNDALFSAAPGSSSQSFTAKITDVQLADFEVSTTVRMTSDKGYEWNWVGLLARAPNANDSFTGGGYLGFIRSNGRADIWSAAGGTLAWNDHSGFDPKASRLRLTMRGIGTHITLLINGTPVVDVPNNGAYASGYAGIQNYADAENDDFVLKTPGQASPPTIFAVSPGCASYNGGLQVTMTGFDFTPGQTGTGNPGMAIWLVNQAVGTSSATSISAWTLISGAFPAVRGEVAVISPDSIQTGPNGTVQWGFRAALGNAFVRAVRGDANNDGMLSTLDLFYLNNYLYSGGPPPFSLCNGDANSDGIISTADYFFLNNYLYSGGPAPGP